MNRFGLPVSVAIATAVTMAGAVLVIFWLLLNFEPPGFLEALPIYLAIPAGLPLILGPLLVAGAMWGALIAHLFGRPLVPAARTGALSVTGMIALLELPVHLSQALAPPGWLPRPLGIHFFFTLIFMFEVALVSGVSAARLCARLGVDGGPRIGTRAGIAGALGFALGSVVAAAMGFVVGEPPGTNMVWALHVGNVFAGLSAGWQFGRQLDAARSAVPPVGVRA
ncbi:MAG TPA: hypothetical protein VLB85_10740 [Acidimicrobiia bacterium]|nr:hypothetical protein [Acidimicrobiia bacterium]